MVVTVQVAADVARSLHQEAPDSDDSRNLTQALDKLGVVLKPMHPGTEEADLIGWFTTEALDLATAQRVVAGLQRRQEVKAAYIKPHDEMP